MKGSPFIVSNEPRVDENYELFRRNFFRNLQKNGWKKDENNEPIYQKILKIFTSMKVCAEPGDGFFP